MISERFKSVQRDWEIEVEEEAAELIESGTPPYDAIQQAVAKVSRRRRDRRREANRAAQAKGGNQ